MTIRDAAKAFGQLGGRARAARLSPEQRTTIARKAARARWSKLKSRTKKVSAA